MGDEWHRLPWKNRTALGWNDAGRRLIAPLSGGLEIALRSGDAEVFRGPAALNGFTLPGERGGIVNGFSLLSPRFKPVYTLQIGERAAAIRAGQNHRVSMTTARRFR